MSEGMAYIARRECGCIMAAVVDNPARRNETAEFVAELIQDGLAVERVTVEVVRAGFQCPEHARQCKLALR